MANNQNADTNPQNQSEQPDDSTANQEDSPQNPSITDEDSRPTAPNYSVILEPISELDIESLDKFMSSSFNKTMSDSNKGAGTSKGDQENKPDTSKIDPAASLPKIDDLSAEMSMLNIGTAPLIIPHNLGLEPLNEVYQRHNGKIPSSTLAKYANMIAENSTIPGTFSHDWLNKYFLTLVQLEKDKANPEESYKKLDRALMDLPKDQRTTVRLNELVITPRVFDGEHPRAMKWIQEYNEAIVANGWSDTIAIKYLPTFLSKAAKDWYFVEIKPKLTDEVKWQHVYKIFVSNFLSEKDYEQLSAALENIRQRPDESVSVFFPRLRRLLLLLTPGMADGEQFRQLKNRLRPEYKQLIAFANPKTITELRDCCLKVEAGMVKHNYSAPRSTKSDFQKGPPARKGRRPPRRSSSTARSNTRGNFRKQSNYRGNRSNSRVNSSGDKSGPSRHGKSEVNQKSTIECYNCGKKGHYSRDCRSKEGRRNDSKPKFARGKQHVNFVQDGNGRDEAATQVLTIRHASKDAQKSKPRFAITELKQEKINLVVGGGRLLRQKVVVNDVEIDAIVDTGAYISVIDAEIANHFKWKIAPPLAKLVGADGNSLESNGSTWADIEVTINRTSKRTKHRVAIVKRLTAPMLLGLELMKRLGICIDADKSEIRFARGDKGGIRLIQDEILPPRSQTVVEAQVNMVGLVMAVPFMHENGVAVANSISEVNDNALMMAVLNPSHKPVKLAKGTKLASAELLKDDDYNKVARVELQEQSNYAKRIGMPKANVRRVVPIPKLEGEIVAGIGLDSEQVAQLKSLLNDHAEAFSIHGEIGKTNVQKHSIELLPNAEPIAEPLRRRAPIQIEETRRQVRELIKEGIVEESNSPWASAYVLAKKKNGEMRLCIDFRKLNAVTKKSSYPLPNIQECLETLSGKRYFTQLDFKSGFWQIEMAKESKELTAFRTEDGLFQFKRMPFGLTNAPATFQKMINTVLAGLKGMNLQVFIDDICIATKTWSEHLAILKLTLKTIIQANLKIKADKCVFGSNNIKFLGHEISQQGIRQDPDKLRALREIPPPTDCKGIKRVLGMFSYYRQFVPKFALLAEPLTKLTRKGVSFVWGEEQSLAFFTILRELGENATLAHFNHTDPIMLKTDASKKGVAGMLLQKQGEDWRIITCCSRRLTDSETNYGITDLEGLAVIYTVTKLRPYLLGKKFQILVDHCALCVLNKRTPSSARLRRWAIVLSEFDFEIVYTKGKLHCDIDCLSRAPVDDPTDDYLDNRVYTVSVRDPWTWTSHYHDNQESKDFLQKGHDKEGGFTRDENGVIYKDELIYVPPAMRIEIITSVHTSSMNAHPGILATISKLKENYWWPDMHKDVEMFVKRCLECATNKPNRVAPAGSMHSFKIFAPGEQVAVDLIEKMKPSVQGNEYIIVAIDMFTRFVEAKAVPDKSTPHFVQFLIEYAGRYGVPRTILSDNAGVFTSEFAKQLMQVFGAAHVKTTPHHSQSNAVVERVNQTLEEKLRLVLSEPMHDRSWDSVLPIAVLAINTTQHTSLGCTPYEMTFGRRAPLQDKYLTVRASPTDMHIKLIRNYLQECHSNAVAIQCASQERAKKYYEDKRRNVLYEIGDIVLVENPARSKSKLDPRFKGPYKIVGRENDIYTLEDTQTGKTTSRHVSNLRHTPHLEVVREDDVEDTN